MIKVDKDQSLTALTTDVSRNPITDDYLHVVFQKVEKGASVNINVPIELEGQLTGEASNLVLITSFGYNRNRG